MKRQHIIERLVAVNYCDPKLLHGLNNDHLNNLYHHVWPRIVMRTERERRRKERLSAERQAQKFFDAWQAERRAKWVHPKVQYPLTGPGRIEERPRLDFGLNDLRETASWMAHHHGDSNALATLRLLAGRPKEEHNEIRRRGKRRNHRGRFRRPRSNSVWKQLGKGHSGVA